MGECFLKECEKGNSPGRYVFWEGEHCGTGGINK